MTPNTLPLSAAAGDVLFHPGQECAGFVFLKSGSIRVTLTAENGREVVLYRVGPGDVCLQTFTCLIEGRDYAAEGVAETDLVGEILPHSQFQHALATDPDFRMAIFSAVAKRFADYERVVEDVALTGFDTRLARALLRLAGPSAEITVSHDDIAAETASGRAVVSRRLAALARQGVIATGRRRIEILQRAKLQRIAGAEG